MADDRSRLAEAFQAPLHLFQRHHWLGVAFWLGLAILVGGLLQAGLSDEERNQIDRDAAAAAIHG